MAEERARKASKEAMKKFLAANEESRLMKLAAKKKKIADEIEYTKQYTEEIEKQVRQIYSRRHREFAALRPLTRRNQGAFCLLVCKRRSLRSRRSRFLGRDKSGGIRDNENNHLESWYLSHRG